MDVPELSPGILHLAENTELSLGSLQAIAAIRARLDVLEKAAMVSAREKGATNREIAEALNLTPQSVYYRFRSMSTNNGNLLIGRGRRPNATDRSPGTQGPEGSAGNTGSSGRNASPVQNGS